MAEVFTSCGFTLTYYMSSLKYEVMYRRRKKYYDITSVETYFINYRDVLWCGSLGLKKEMRF